MSVYWDFGPSESPQEVFDKLKRIKDKNTLYDNDFDVSLIQSELHPIDQLFLDILKKAKAVGGLSEHMRAHLRGRFGRLNDVALLLKLAHDSYERSKLVRLIKNISSESTLRTLSAKNLS